MLNKHKQLCLTNSVIIFPRSFYNVSIRLKSIEYFWSLKDKGIEGQKVQMSKSTRDNADFRTVLLEGMQRII